MSHFTSFNSIFIAGLNIYFFFVFFRRRRNVLSVKKSQKKAPFIARMIVLPNMLIRPSNYLKKPNQKAKQIWKDQFWSLIHWATLCYKGLVLLLKPRYILGYCLTQHFMWSCQKVVPARNFTAQLHLNSMGKKRKKVKIKSQLFSYKRFLTFHTIIAAKNWHINMRLQPRSVVRRSKQPCKSKMLPNLPFPALGIQAKLKS